MGGKCGAFIPTKIGGRYTDMTTEELIEAAYFEGWRDGAATGESDSPDWNAGEDWAESGARKRIKQNTRHEPGADTHNPDECGGNGIDCPLCDEMKDREGI